MRFPLRYLLPLAPILALSGCGSSDVVSPSPASTPVGAAHRTPSGPKDHPILPVPIDSLIIVLPVEPVFGPPLTEP